MHYLQPDEQNKVLSNCINSIPDDGMVIVRDGDADMEEKHKGTKLTELFSTRLIGFNKTSENGLSFLSYKKMLEFAETHHLKLTKIDETKYTSNVFFILKKA